MPVGEFNSAERFQVEDAIRHAEQVSRFEFSVFASDEADAWDLGPGALDDAAGVGIVVAAARLLAELPQPPRRTIRVVAILSSLGGGKT